MEPKYKINPLTGELQEYVFEYNGILVMKNFTARVDGERLIIHSANDVNFSILDALVSEVEVDGVVYDNPTAAQEALQRLVFNKNTPVIMTAQDRQRINEALQSGGYTGTAQDLKKLIDSINRILQSDDTDLDELQEIVAYIKQNKHILSTLGITNIAGLADALAGKAEKNHRHNWNDIQEKPNLDFLPASWNRRNNQEVFKTQQDDWLRINEGTSHPSGTYFGDKVVRTDGELQVGDSGNKFKASNNGNIVNSGTTTSSGFVKSGSNDNNVLLGGGGHKPISEIKQETKNEIQIGGRNLLLNSKEKNTLNGYVGINWKLSEAVQIGKTYTFSCVAEVEEGKRLTVYFTDIHGKPRQYIITDLVNGYNKTTITPKFEWTDITVYHEVVGVVPAPIAKIEKLKFENGNVSTDWTPAPEDLAYFDDVKKYAGHILETTSNYDITAENVGRTVHIKSAITINYNTMPELTTMAFRKVFDGGEVRFTGSTPAIYTGDTVLNGKKGSTAIIDRGSNNQIFIDIRNV